MNVLPTNAIPPEVAMSGDLEALASRPDVDVKEVASKFEGLFVSMLLKTMRESMTSGEMFGGDNADVWGGVFEQYMGDELARSGGLGLVEQLTTQAAQTPGSLLSSLM
jgi:Rod binding domain-containing protein